MVRLDGSAVAPPGPGRVATPKTPLTVPHHPSTPHISPGWDAQYVHGNGPEEDPGSSGTGGEGVMGVGGGMYVGLGGV